MVKKLKTKLTFEFDVEELEEKVPELNFDIDMKTSVKNKRINIIEMKKKKRILDSSTKLF
ncbi:MAG: hypothetical protein WC554_19600 [Clostridia bacterium]|jgi:hypothetical protein